MKTFRNFALATFFSFFIAGYSFASVNTGGVTLKDCSDVEAEYAPLLVNWDICRFAIEYGWGSPGMHTYCATMLDKLMYLQPYHAACLAKYDTFIYRQ